MQVRVPIRVENASSAPIDVMVQASLPRGWVEEDRPRTVRLAAAGDYTIESLVRIPKDAQPGTEVLRYSAAGLGAVAVKVVVQRSGAGLPQ